MKSPHPYPTQSAAAWLCWVLVVAGTNIAAAPPAGPGPGAKAVEPRPAEIADVELGKGGLLEGIVIDVQGTPVSNARVAVRQLDREVATATSDRLGRFAVEQVRGGTYELAVGDHSGLIRAWAPETAPPSARPLALVVVGDHVVRGQLMRVHLGRHLVTGAIVGAIATPIILNNIDKDTSVPVSP